MKKPTLYHLDTTGGGLIGGEEGEFVLFSDWEALNLLNQRNEDGLRQIQEITEHFIPNPGCEMNTVDLVRKMGEMLKDY